MASFVTVGDEVATPQWFYYLFNDPFRRYLDGWYPYDPELNRNVERLYQAHQLQAAQADTTSNPSQQQRPVVAASNNYEYELDFENMSQQNTATGRDRPIARSLNGLPPPTTPELPPMPQVPAMPSMLASMAAAAVSSPTTPALSPVTLTDLLRSNNKTLWKLKLHRENHFDHLHQFCDALRDNTTVTSVELKWKFLRRVTDPALLLESLGGLPNLEEMNIEVVVGHNHLLSNALRYASSKLRCLRIGKLRFASNRDVQELANALQQCQSLQQIGLSSAQFVVEGMDEAADGGVLFLPHADFDEAEASHNNNNDNNENGGRICLDPLLDVLAGLPVLEHIRLQHYLHGRRIVSPNEETLRSLCRSPRRSLILHSCGLSDQQCAVIADELKKSTASKLSVLVVTRNIEISPIGWDAFVDMLAVNYTIVDFHQGEEGQRNAPSVEQIASINFYLGLNQAGRGKLLQGSMTSRRDAWFDFLVQGRHNLDRVFFALQVDPSLYIRPE